VLILAGAQYVTLHIKILEYIENWNPYYEKVDSSVGQFQNPGPIEYKF
jgi:hypothetical protein